MAIDWIGVRERRASELAEPEASAELGESPIAAQEMELGIGEIERGSKGVEIGLVFECFECLVGVAQQPEDLDPPEGKALE